ncbi:MAG: zf-HC2 domain-containing protein [Phycisphaerales bacterium]|nr:MAG: zf-HC2 domain-containing protein [Phycisphaerales bacterium]
MNCQEAKQRWHDRCDGFLSSRDEAALAAHMQACEACRRHHAQMDEMNQALSALRADTEAIGTLDEVPKDRASGRFHPRPARFVFRRISQMAAALALFLGAGWYLAHNEEPTALQENAPIHQPGLGVAEAPIGPVTRPRVVVSECNQADCIAVPQHTSQPKVHLFRLYRVVQPMEEPPSEL